jgi:hypothetical protein
VRRQSSAAALLGAISATARARTSTVGRERRLSEAILTSVEPRTATATRVGANAALAPPGNVTSAGRTATPLRRPPRTAAARANVSYSAFDRWRGFGTPAASMGGSKRRGYASRIASAADIAARSAARWCLPFAPSA